MSVVNDFSDQSSDLRQSRRNDILALSIIALIGLIALSKLLFFRMDLYWGDIGLWFVPMQSFLHKSFADGVVPLWNPHIFSGEPFIGNPQTFILYPIAALLRPFFASPWQFVTVDGALHLILGGILFYPLARLEGLSRKSSVLASVSFMLGGYFVSKLQFPNMTQAIAWLPAALWAVAKLVRKPDFKSAIPLGVIFALQVLAGHAQVTLFTIYLSTGYLFYRRSFEPTKQPWSAILGWGVVAAFFAALLSMGELLPIIENLRHVEHQTLSINIADRFDLAYSQLANCVLPNLYGNPIYGNFHAPGNFWETCCFAGWIGTCLGLFGAAQSLRAADPISKRRLTARFWTFTVIVITWLSLGVQGGIYIDAYHVLPGLKSFHDPARFLLLASVAGSILAGIGLDTILALSKTSSRKLIGGALILGVALELGLFDYNIYPLKSDSDLQAAVSQASAMNSDILPGHRVFSDTNTRTVWNYFVNYHDFRQNDPDFLPTLFSTHAPNLDMLTGVDDAGGYDPEAPRSIVHRFDDPRKFSEMAVDNIFWFRRIPATSGDGFYSFVKGIRWRNPNAAQLSRAKISESGAPLNLIDTSPDTISIAIPPHDHPETVDIFDTALPGWHAQIGQQTVQIKTIADGFREVDLSPSNQADILTMRYLPASWRVGLYLSLASMAFVLGFGINAVLSRK